MNLAIYGAGSLGKEIYSMLKMNATNTKWDKVVFIDDICQNNQICGIQRYSFEDFCRVSDSKQYKIVIASGEPHYRKKMYDSIRNAGYSLASIVASNAYIGMESDIEKGAVIFPNVYISNSVHVGENSVILANAKIECESIVGDNSFISGGAYVGANTQIGESAFIGPNASVMDHTVIGSDSIVGMGSVVIENIEPGNVVVGNPAKVIRQNQTHRIFKEKYCQVADGNE